MTKRSKKSEFSKKWLAGCVIFSIVFTSTSYILAFLDKQPLETLSAAIIEALWGTSGVSFIGYAIQNSVRAFTASKFGIPEEKEKKHGTERHHCPVCGSDYPDWSDNLHGGESED